MSGELERPGIEGKVIMGGLAQTVTREGHVTRITLTRIPGQPMACTTSGPATSIPLPEPVTVAGGGLVVVDMEWLPPAVREETSARIAMAHGTTLHSVTAGALGPAGSHAVGGIRSRKPGSAARPVHGRLPVLQVT